MIYEATTEYSAPMQAKDLGIYQALVQIVKTGASDSSRINWDASFESCTIRATLGAGTNSASLTMQDGRVLYESHNRGELVTTFRYGPWVQRFLYYAKTLAELAEAINNAKAKIDERKRIERFLDIDF